MLIFRGWFVSYPPLEFSCFSQSINQSLLSYTFVLLQINKHCSIYKRLFAQLVELNCLSLNQPPIP